MSPLPDLHPPLPEATAALLEAVDGARWVKWDHRTHRLFVWTGEANVRVYDERSGQLLEQWPLPDTRWPRWDAAADTVSQRLNAGY